MNNLLRCLFLFLTLICSECISAQINLYGCVKDETGVEIPNVNIVVRTVDSLKIKAFTISDVNGNFFIKKQIRIDGMELSFKCLGYKEVIVKLRPNMPELLNIIMSEEAYKLKEVKVVPKPIRTYGDTTQYYLSAFTNGLEKNVEDVLKKLPGINVSDEGNISFRGKSITKILLDNVDLFDKNYKIASQTIPARLISSVEAIEYYQENRLLKNVKESDDVILNLSFKSDMDLQRPTGQVEIGGGYENRYDLRANLMSMNKYIKLYNAAAFSNINESPDFLDRDAVSNNSLMDIVGDYQEANGIDNVKQTEQKSESNTFNIVYQPTEKVQIKGQFLANKNKYKSNSRERTLYFDDSLLIEKSTYRKNLPVVLNGNAELKYDINKSILMSYKTQFLSDDKLGRNKLYLPDVSDYNTDRKLNFQSHVFELTHKLSDKSVIMLDLSAYLTGDKQNFNYLNREQEIRQRLKDNRQAYNARAAYLKKQGRFSWELAAGYRYNNENIDVLQLKNESMFSDYSRTILYLEGNISYSYKSSSLKLQTQVNVNNQNITSSNLEAKKFEKIEFSPELTYQFKLRKHRFTVSGQYRREDMEPINFVGFYSDYRDYFRPAAEYNSQKSKVSLNCNYSLFTGNVFLLANYTYFKTYHNFFNGYDISPQINYRTLLADKDINTHLGFFNIKYYLDDIRQGVELMTNIYGSKYFSQVNGQPRNNTLLSHSSKLSLKSSFNFPLNYNIGVNYRQSSFLINREKMKNVTYSFFEDIICNFGKGFIFKLSFDEHFLGKDKSFYLFICPKMDYEMKKYNLKLSLDVYNVLNNKAIFDYILTDYYSTEYYNSIVPAYCMLSVSFRY